MEEPAGNRAIVEERCGSVRRGIIVMGAGGHFGAAVCGFGNERHRCTIRAREVGFRFEPTSHPGAPHVDERIERNRRHRCQRDEEPLARLPL